MDTNDILKELSRLEERIIKLEKELGLNEDLEPIKGGIFGID